VCADLTTGAQLVGVMGDFTLGGLTKMFEINAKIETEITET
jgi:hypothetical protein